MIEQEACRRLEQRGVAIREQIAREVRQAVEQVHRELCEQLGEHLEAMQPTLGRIRELQAAHPDVIGGNGVPTFHELILTIPGSKAAAWARAIQPLGVDVRAS